MCFCSAWLYLSWCIEVIVAYPYANGASNVTVIVLAIDCTESTIKGYLHRVFYRVRATAMPGFDSSYKTAATNSITFAAIDPKRADKKMADWIYEPLDENGEIVTKSEGTVNWN